jgi:RNA polymerase sigma-70 factor (ECF subfamily)
VERNRAAVLAQGVQHRLQVRRPPDEAEDLTQDIFLKLFKSLKTFDRRANFSTWLISVSRNLCIDHYRSMRREHDG